ncbi:hypothetical protein SAMN02927900_01741 [Rhizobium mongolense subsp. loessense]|uniref:Uncharacterized protein n=1 Tax=Rhizobium mongolense subsp. loessense TaxID=158890 RepID=A0A1G4QQR3_9HYPH|nr:hypothetical protein SAMN02927900_01741 [Rhizobium mongolense subsp. loessense]
MPHRDTVRPSRAGVKSEYQTKVQPFSDFVPIPPLGSYSMLVRERVVSFRHG